MKVLFLTSGKKTPSSRFRVYQYIPFLEQRGIICIIAPCIPNKYYGSPLRGAGPAILALKIAKRIYDLFNAFKVDIVFLERDLLPIASFWLERLLFLFNPNVIFDIDDAIFLKYKNKVDSIIKKSKVVIAGNDYLAAYANQFNQRVFMITTGVDAKKYKLKSYSHSSKIPIIGWTGTSSNLHYMEMLRKPLGKLCDKHNFILRVISDNPHKARQFFNGIKNLTIDAKEWSEASEIEDLTQFDIGLMPLNNGIWERGKCSFKLIQYMALGIPAVVSPVGENIKIISEGENGLFANSDEEWESRIEQLLGSIELRMKMGKKGRELVEQNYSIEANLPSLLKALEYARKNN